MNNNERDFDQTCRFLIRLGEAAHSYGSNAARLEDFMKRVEEEMDRDAAVVRSRRHATRNWCCAASIPT